MRWSRIHAIGKPTLLIHSGIHPGKIDVKDAGFMLLHDIAFGTQTDLLEQVKVG